MKYLKILCVIFISLTDLAAQRVTVDMKGVPSETEGRNFAISTACACIDSISLDNKSSEFVKQELDYCIDSKMIYIRASDLIMQELSKTLASTIKREWNSGSKKNNLTIKADAVQLKLDIFSEAYHSDYKEFKSSLLNSCSPYQNKKRYSEKGLKANEFSSNKKANKFFQKAESLVYGLEKHKSIKFYKKALKKDANFAYAYQQLGRCYFIMGKYNEAINYQKKSINYSNTSTSAYLDLANYYELNYEHKKAYEIYIDKLKTDFNNPYILTRLGLINSIRFNKYEEGIVQLLSAYQNLQKFNSPLQKQIILPLRQVFEKMKRFGKEGIFRAQLVAHNLEHLEEILNKKKAD